MPKKEKLFLVEVYGYCHGVCTQSFKKEVLKEWANEFGNFNSKGEWKGNMAETKRNVEFKKVEINKLTD